ncbi:ABC transporter substrate-binding protein [Ilumatobacter nonamiensis]|uniref:ABC transporter substrate-binding protein n=1 Tax=Ilumatobacter nonamiensis TaxID=467093 RepID=UPI00058BB9A8|nr:sugar ABC transporter substrate-binding protein [Ilumatobacter nonamiensis]
MNHSRPFRRRPVSIGAATVVAFSLVAAACGSDDDSSSDDAAASDDSSAASDDSSEASEDAPEGDRSINVAIVGNPQLESIAELTPELFTAETGIEVNYTVLEEQALREITTRDVGAGGEQFDVVQIGMFEAPQFGANGWLVPLDDFAADDPDYNPDDLIPAVADGLSYDGSLYASPFYAESSFVMYRQDVLDEAGLTMPDEPTWDEVAEIARAVDSDEMAGICLRGKPGWGDLGASFTTVLNTFGGTWWAANEDGTIGEAQVDQPEFAEALNFYVDLVNDAGEDDAANSSFNECLALYQDGKVAMWYDATVAAGLLEADDSPVQGLNSFALAPTKETDASGWLWAWALAIPVSTTDQDAAWDFISWATSEEYINSAGEMLPGGWAAVPPGTRTSTYENEDYLAAAESFAPKTLDAMNAAPIDNPGTTPRPGLPGVQYVGVPEFQDVGTRCTEQFSSAIAGNTSVDDALSACQDIASEYSS